MLIKTGTQNGCKSVVTGKDGKIFFSDNDRRDFNWQINKKAEDFYFPQSSAFCLPSSVILSGNRLCVLCAYVVPKNGSLLNT
jgi:hypothetical protein